jgi:hypothetical protein
MYSTKSVAGTPLRKTGHLDPIAAGHYPTALLAMVHA